MDNFAGVQEVEPSGYIQGDPATHPRVWQGPSIRQLHSVPVVSVALLGVDGFVQVSILQVFRDQNGLAHLQQV